MLASFDFDLSLYMVGSFKLGHMHPWKKGTTGRIRLASIVKK
jgi:hypothetical protein